MNQEEPTPIIDEFGIYDTKDEVSLFIVTYKKLPKNYYKKNQFYDISDQWNMQNKISCGGDTFKNREGLLPKNDHYIECDIEYRGGGRNAKRLVFSIETLNVFYTSDHYKSFTQIYRNGKRT